jgi:ABC-type glycerol-3-phosphate transport system substrate-binding protein
MYFELTTTGAGERSIQTLDAFLKQYQFSHPGIDFELQNLEWSDAWPQLMRIMLDKSKVVVSEVGSPWVSDFVAMRGLRPFSSGEVEALGGIKSFFSAPWSNVMASPSSLDVSGTPTVYALPARVDVRVIYYWKDMLEKAGVDPAEAFTTPQQLEDTLVKLRATGTEPAYCNPWVYETHATRNWVYNMASWIWAYGGDFVDEKGLPAFDQPAALEGITAYFRLHRFLAPTAGGETIAKVFAERRTAVMLFGTYFHFHLLRGEGFPVPGQIIPLLGAAQLPGPAFVGGSSFVIWAHAPYRSALTAIDLLTQFLSSSHLPDYCYWSEMMPSRVNGFDHSIFSTDPFKAILKSSIETGRTHKMARLFMVIADRLSAVCRAISVELLQNPDQDVQPIVEKHICNLAQRLRISFSERT